MGDSRVPVLNSSNCRNSFETQRDGQLMQEILLREPGGGITTRSSAVGMKNIDEGNGRNSAQPLSWLRCGVKPSTLACLGGGQKHAKTGKSKTIQIPKTLMKKNRGNTMGKALFKTFVANDTLVSQESIKPWWSYGLLPQGVKTQQSIVNSDRDIENNSSTPAKTKFSNDIILSGPSKMLSNLDGSRQTIEIRTIRNSIKNSPMNATDSLSTSMVNMPSTRVIQNIKTLRDSEKNDLLFTQSKTPMNRTRTHTDSDKGDQDKPRGKSPNNVLKKSSFSEVAEKNKGCGGMSLFKMTQCLIEEKRVNKTKINPDHSTDIDVDVDVDISDNVSRLQAAPETSVHEEETSCALDGNGNVYFMPHHSLYRKPKKYNKDTDTLCHWLGNEKLPMPKRCKEDCGHKTGRLNKDKSS
jgi:hypothetical protein